MSKLCGKCGGSGWWGSRFDLYPNKGGPCRTCNGTGYDQRWGTTSCKGCGTSLEYKVYWSHIPEYCSSCKEWKTKPCKGCGTEVRYKTFWEHIPDICSECKKMAKRRGADEICRNTDMERWLVGRSGDRVQNMGDHFHVTLYVDGGHVSGDVDKYSTKTWNVHGRIRNYNKDGSQGPRSDDLYFEF